MDSKREGKREMRDDSDRKRKKRKKGKKHKDEGTSNPSQIGLDDSKQQRRKDQSQNDTTPEKVLDDSKVHYSPKWSSSSSEPEHEALCMPKRLVAQNFPVNVSKAQVKSFFKGKPVEVLLANQRNEKLQVVAMQALISFDSVRETDEALKLCGNLYHGKAINVVRNGNSRSILFVRGFNNQTHEDVIKRQLKKIFQKRGKVLNIFLPKDSITGYSLGFAYVYLDHEGKDEKKICQPATINGVGIHIRNARPRQCFHAEMVGEETILKKEDKKTALKRVLLPINRNVQTSKKTFSWKKKRPDITADPYEQVKCNCWAVALSRAYTALLRLSKSDGPPLTVEQLEELVDPAHQVTGTGINRFRNAIPAMCSKYVKDMKIYHRPRGDDVTQFEDFEKFVIKLLKKSPVAVSVDYLDDARIFDGEGTYRPTEVDSNMRTFEKFPLHTLLLTGYGVENGIEFWEFHDSNGADWGDNGFIRMERHKVSDKRSS